MTPTALEDRIVQLALTPLGELPNELTKLGLIFEIDESGYQLNIKGKSMNVGLCECDPITKAVQLGFALCGPLWPHVMPNLLKKVDREYKLRVKARKSCLEEATSTLNV